MIWLRVGSYLDLRDSWLLIVLGQMIRVLPIRDRIFCHHVQSPQSRSNRTRSIGGSTRRADLLAMRASNRLAHAVGGNPFVAIMVRGRNADDALTRATGL